MYKPQAVFEKADKRDRFAQVSVLVADSDSRTADLVRRVLFSFGFRQIFVADNPDDAIMQMRSKRIELVISELRMERGGGIRLLRTVRGMADEKHLKRDVPIIILTAESDMDTVRAARDSGVTEFVAKPFSAKTLSHRIVQVIDNPRVFVESPNYVGPCRRRKKPVPPDKDRRKPKVAKPLDIGGIDQMFAGLSGITIAGMVKVADENGAAIYAANHDIRLQLGEGVRAEDILNDVVVAEAQQEIKRAESEFLEWAKSDIEKLEAAYAELSERHGDPMAHHLMLTAAYSIKAQAGIFGYDLGTQIGKMLVDYLQHNPTIEASRLLVVRKHIDAIKVIFNQQMKEVGQVIGKELIASLEKLVAKVG